MHTLSRRHLLGGICGGCAAVQLGLRATPAQAQQAAPAGAAAAGQQNWFPSRWGPQDEIGAANLLTPQKVQQAAQLVREGRTWRMGIVVGRDTPAYPPRNLAVTILMPNQYGGAVVPSENRVSYVDDMITGWLGVGTQIDGLAHLGIDNVFYNGNRAGDFVRVTGVTKLGIEKIPPIVTRGVLIDLARFRNKPRLEGGELVTAEELRTAMQQQNVQVTPGDVVVLHTGWLSVLDEDAQRFGAEEPGIDGEGAAFLASLQPVAVGADTWGVEAVPFRNPSVLWEGHQVLLARNGIYILENLDTRGLVRDGVTEFMFVLGQPLYRGAVQAIINPVAIR
ncbi:cyclase family protein [Crenalkalicoccus roseus]|uniref:cyclase family protein n=1 Tax=Crenalkalicoccus roseus TaxID=1485588 RepID=UPI0010820787|nr:cyclase family protein [Crenalkalicoccus roseus]